MCYSKHTECTAEISLLSRPFSSFCPTRYSNAPEVPTKGASRAVLSLCPSFRRRSKRKHGETLFFLVLLFVSLTARPFERRIPDQCFSLAHAVVPIGDPLGMHEVPLLEYARTQVSDYVADSFADGNAYGDLDADTQVHPSFEHMSPLASDSLAADEYRQSDRSQILETTSYQTASRPARRD